MRYYSDDIRVYSGTMESILDRVLSFGSWNGPNSEYKIWGWYIVKRDNMNTDGKTIYYNDGRDTIMYVDIKYLYTKRGGNEEDFINHLPGELKDRYMRVVYDEICDEYNLYSHRLFVWDEGTRKVRELDL